MTYDDRWEDVDREISIHIPRVGDDAGIVCDVAVPGRFQSTSPVWGMTAVVAYIGKHRAFQSTSPVWGMTQVSFDRRAAPLISIHIPRVGDDADAKAAGDAIGKFQSTSPVWGMTSGEGKGDPYH